MFKAPKRIAVDFDGTLCDMAFPNIGEVKAGAKAALTLFRQLGYKVIIWSCRCCHWDYDVYGGDPSQPVMERPSVTAMVSFLEANGIEYDEIDDGSRGKPSADFYIDDKGIRFDENWLEIVSIVLKHEYRQIQAIDAITARDSTKPQTCAGKLIPFTPRRMTEPSEPEGPMRA